MTDAAVIARDVPHHAQDIGQLLELYRGAFPAAERKTDEAFLAMTEREDYLFLLARAVDGIVGFAAVQDLGDDLYLLEYMAVATSQRDQGLGGRMLEHTIATIGPLATLLLEVEAAGPDDPPSAPTMRRLRFYFAHGCREVAGLSYILPLYDNAPVMMSLLVHDGLCRSTIDWKTLSHWLTRIYRNAYGKGPDDPRLERMLDGCKDVVRLTSG
jgi:ribosomal protein S18 acetylase RimI-like enzyme